MKTSEKIDQWTLGMIAFRKDLIQPVKDANNPFFKSNYVTLEGTITSVDTAIKQVGEKNGITFSQEVTGDPASNTVSVTTLVSHVSGQYVMFGPLVMPVLGKKAGVVPDAQAYGSSITYAKRYALSAALGIASDVDDDGNTGSNVSQSNSNTKYSNNSRPAKNTRPAKQNNNNQQQQQQQQVISKHDVDSLNKALTQMSDKMNINKQALANSVFNYLSKNFNYKTDTFVGLPLKYSDEVFNFLDYVSNKYQQDQLDQQQKSMNDKQAAAV